MQSPNASTRFTLLPTNYLASQPPASEITLQSLIDTSDRMAEEAREALPYSFDECTYDKGYLRQSVWSCLDCGEKGVCYGCSISCHAEHRLVELWTRRHFRCDCPTVSTQPDPPTATKRRRCTLYPPQSQPQEANEENKYTQNFKGKFCRCGREYDAETETEAMICCIGCEDWFHESCLDLRQPTPSTSVPATREPQCVASSDAQPAATADSTSAFPPSVPEASTNTTSTTLPIPDEEDDEEAAVLIPSESYDGLICASCVKGNEYLRSKAGQEGWMIIEPTAGGSDVVGRVKAELGEDGSSVAPRTTDATREGKEDAAAAKVDATGDGTNVNGKRDLEEDLAKVGRKKIKLDNDGVAELVYGRGTQAENATEARQSIEQKDEWQWKGKGDIFLSNGVREALKGTLDEETIKSLPFPLVDEGIYEPPQDDDQEETMEQVTTRVMDQLPRVQAIEALHGYQRLKERLNDMLRTHVESGRSVSKEDIEGLFEQLRGGSR